MSTVRLRLLWHPQAQFAGALLAEHGGIAERHGIKFECQPINFDEDPISAVLSGNAELCVASPSHILESDEPESLAMVLTFQQKSPVVYLARRDHGINSIDCLAGKQIAVWPGNEDLELRWLLHKSGVPTDDIELVPSEDTVELLLEGKVSCAQLTTYNEYLKYSGRIGSEKETMLEFSARDHDADLIKDGIIARKSWLESETQSAQAAVDSLLEGWTRALEEPHDVVNVCTRVRPDLDEQFHKNQFERIKDLILCGATLTHGLGYPDANHVRRARTAVETVNAIEMHEGAGDCVDEYFWNCADPSLRRSTW